MTTQRTDFLVGLFMMVAVGVVVGAIIVTSGLGEVRYDLFLRTASAENLATDTRVLLQGLAVGRVRQVSPVIDTTTGRIEFVARLSLQDRFPNGAELTLPVGTRAVISQPTPIAPPVVQLVVPETPPGAFLAPGDTLPAERLQNVLDAIGQIATELRVQLTGALADTRALMARTDSTLRQTQQLMRANSPLVRSALERLATNLERTQGILDDIQPRVGPMQDSIMRTLTDTRRVLARADSLLASTHTLVIDNRDAVAEVSDLLLRSARILEHFADQVSRRPTRLLTGVRPPPADSAREQQP